MIIEDYFSHNNLNEIFKLSPSYSDRIISRESSILEFKESFGWNGFLKCTKTFAAFANTKGGYIVFGVANNPHVLRGLSGKSIESFRTDPEKITSVFNEHFAPEIKWDITEYELQGKVFGVIYISEASDKPVICLKNLKEYIREGDIFYRYRGRSERIKYPELKALIDFKREREQNLWMKHIKNIARIGVREAGIFDLQTGCVTGSGGSFLIDETLLSQLSFIKEGEFSEVKGKPTLKLIGSVEPLIGISLSKKKKIIIKGITTDDIILNFLNDEKVPEPKDFIEQICNETTAFLPVYYYIDKAKLTCEESIEIVKKNSSRRPSKRKIIERLTSRKTEANPIRKDIQNTANSKKIEYISKLLANTVDVEISGKELIYCLQAIRGLEKKQINSNSKYLRELLKTWFKKHYSEGEQGLVDHLRRAICWVDESLYMPK